MGVSDVTALSKTSNMASAEDIFSDSESEFDEGEKNSSDPS